MSLKRVIHFHFVIHFNRSNINTYYTITQCDISRFPWIRAIPTGMLREFRKYTRLAMFSTGDIT